jgi:hypothetical protein
MLRCRQRRCDLIDRTGNRYGRLVAVSYIDEERKWLCKCDCGKEVLLRSTVLNYNASKRGHAQKSCGCLAKEVYKILGAKLGSSQHKQLAYRVDANGCHICTSHKPEVHQNKGKSPSYVLAFTPPESPRKRVRIRNYLWEKANNRKILPLSRITMTCNNPLCINIAHMLISKNRVKLREERHVFPTFSETSVRIHSLTPHKRGTQVGMIKAIQATLGDMNPEGDWIHTSGPGKVAINYWIYERALHEDATYVLVEIEPQSFEHMKGEGESLRKQLRHHQWQNRIAIERGEIFLFATKRVLSSFFKSKVLVVDADLCCALPTLIKQGILNGIANLCEAQSYHKHDFFISLTFSTRKAGTHAGEDQLEQVIAHYKGIKIYDHSYKDGAPMRTITWYFNPR